MNNRNYCQDSLEIFEIVQRNKKIKKDGRGYLRNEIVTREMQNRSSDENKIQSGWQPFIVQYGDASSIIPKELGYVPVIKKFRVIESDNMRGEKNITTCRDQRRKKIDPKYSAIIWKLNVHRHYGQIPIVPFQDTPYGYRD